MSLVHRILRRPSSGALVLALLTGGLAALAEPATADRSADRVLDHSHAAPALVASLGSGSGSTIGPDGALYVAQPATGSIARVDLRTGATATYATGLPTRLPGFAPGGVTDVAFLGHTAYALVTLVGPDVGGTSAVGLYRIRPGGTPTLAVDLGTWSAQHPPRTTYFVPSGVQHALESWHGGFLVTDGHHNRVLRVTRHGAVSPVLTLGNVVPTGLDLLRGRVLLALAGPVPHEPADGQVVSFRPRSTDTSSVDIVAAGAAILTDVEAAPWSRHGHSRAEVYAVSNGTYSGEPEGAPGLPDTGALVRATRHGGFDVITSGLDRPTSVELRHGTAYVLTYDGDIWAVPLRR